MDNLDLAAHPGPRSLQELTAQYPQKWRITGWGTRNPPEVERAFRVGYRLGAGRCAASDLERAADFVERMDRRRGALYWGELNVGFDRWSDRRAALLRGAMQGALDALRARSQGVQRGLESWLEALRAWADEEPISLAWKSARPPEPPQAEGAPLRRKDVPKRLWSEVYGMWTLFEAGAGSAQGDLKRSVTAGSGSGVAIEGRWARTVVESAQTEPDEGASSLPDPGPLPQELLRVPGFVSQVMDHVLDVAPYPSVALSFGGALALQAALAGRKVRDPGDNRTNLYLLALAFSSVGKNKPRQINDAILQEAGLEGCIGGRFASGEGIEDALGIEPCMLFQTDEIDALLQSINKAKDARHEQMMATLLTMYSSANASFPMRRKAGKETPGAIDQPCLVLFGTAIPNHYYQALSERMLTNGFFARMIIVECEKRPPGQEPKILPIPKRVLETATWWADFRPGDGNLEHWHPVPKIVPHTEEAKRLLVEMRLEAEAEYGKAEDARDPVGTTVWGRVSEHIRKLALIHALSEDHHNPRIGQDAVLWARRFVFHQTKRMLFMAQAHVADNPFHAECLKLKQKLREAPDRTLPHSVLLKRMKMDTQTFVKLIQTLEQSGEVTIQTQSGSGRPRRSYRLMEAARGG